MHLEYAILPSAGENGRSRWSWEGCALRQLGFRTERGSKIHWIHPSARQEYNPHIDRYSILSESEGPD